MKKVSVLLASVLLSVVALSGCNGGSSSLKPAEGDVIYTTEAAYYDSSVEPYSLHIDIGEGYKIDSITMSRYTASDYTYKGGILSLPGDFFTQQGTGEKTLVVNYTDGTSIRIPVMVCSKFIYTAEDFQNINDNLDGTYLLANDIDLSSIANFEPLGWYYEETDPTNHYFHGILEGNGHKVYGGNVEFSKLPDATASWVNGTPSYPSNSDVYYGTYGFSMDAHTPGDNIGIFQMIGSSGVVRNVWFDNINVVGRTICGVIAGNCSGVIENCLVTNSSVTMATHFYDDDCNCGGAVGIVASGAVVSNTVVYNTDVKILDYFIDFGDTYIGQIGNDNWDHASSGDHIYDPMWIFTAVDKDGSGSDGKALDSNGCRTNGTYAFVGKCWGDCVNCFAETFTVTQPTIDRGFPERTVCFGQTHKGENKPESGSDDLGSFTNCQALSESELSNSSLYTNAGYDTTIWNLGSGLPTLNCPVISSYIY